MNKTAIRNFAVWARNKLINDVTYRAGLMGVTANGIADPLPQSTDNVQFFDIGMAEPYQITGEEIKQRKSLVEIIKRKEKDSDYATAFTSVVEEVSYTWFNRLIAIRYMEVNDYLPSHIRVLSSESGKLEPDLVTTPYDADLFFANGEEQIVQKLKNDNKLDEVFRMIFIKQCNALYTILPRLFENLSDYTELLLNVSFIDQDGVVYHLVHDIPEEDFNVELGGQVEIIGWLYQYYNAELKDETFDLLKKNIKVTKERVPSATQLFTPDWIVRYMVENSLGRLWLDGHQDDNLKNKWKYYLEECEQTEDVKQLIIKINKNYECLCPEDIKVIDPCMGSGHVLVYAFEVLMQIYESAGWSQREAAKSILNNNLYGLDIDDRAAQLSYFAVLMKARQYNRRILNEEINCNVIAIQESNGFDKNSLKHLDDLSDLGGKIIDYFVDSKEYGSILKIDINIESLELLNNKLKELENKADYRDIFSQYEISVLLKDFRQLLNQAMIMVQKYWAVITNPPYMGNGNMSSKLSEYAKNEYPDSKSDLSTICMEKTLEMLHTNGYMAMINIPVWMFIQAYKKHRENLLSNNTFVNLLHNGRGVFGSDFGSTAFVISKDRRINYKGLYLRLFDNQNSVDNVEIKKEWFFERKNISFSSQESFYAIPSLPIAYWLSEEMLNSFRVYKPIKEYAIPASGTSTGDNDRFLRLWYEVGADSSGFSLTAEYDGMSVKWVPCNKGGAYRRWYGNNDYLMDWENNGYGIRNNKDERGKLRSRPLNLDKNFKAGLTWTKVGAGTFSVRYFPEGFICESIGAALYPQKGKSDLLLGLLNSRVACEIMAIINPTMGCQPGDVAQIPTFIPEEREEMVTNFVKQCISNSKDDWDSFETSWDFKKHPLI